MEVFSGVGRNLFVGGGGFKWVAKNILRLRAKKKFTLNIYGGIVYLHNYVLNVNFCINLVTFSPFSNH